MRQLFGYERFDRRELVALVNNVYANEWRLLNNFFVPTMKLMEKKRVGSKMIKKHGIPKTPAQRLLESEHLSEVQKERIKDVLAHLDPFVLQELVQEKLKRFFSALHSDS